MPRWQGHLAVVLLSCFVAVLLVGGCEKRRPDAASLPTPDETKAPEPPATAPPPPPDTLSTGPQPSPPAAPSAPAAMPTAPGVPAGVPRPPQPASSANPREACQSNLKQVGLAFLMYMQDYDERFVPADRWHTGIYPYLRNATVLACPSDSQDGAGSYAYNANLSYAEVHRIPSPAQTILSFESNLHHTNASDTGASLARPPRHDGGNNYGFTDGHVKWATDVPGTWQLGSPRPPAKRR